MSTGNTHPAMHSAAAAGLSHTEHYVPLGWEETDRGLCPCGEAVRWDEEHERWVPDRSLVVLVLTPDEMFSVVDRLKRAGPTAALPEIELQRELNVWPDA